MNTNKKGFAIASLIIGILSITICCVGGSVLGILGFILGIVSLCRRESLKGLAIGGMITSVLGVVAGVAILAFIFFIADEDKDLDQSSDKSISEDVSGGNIGGIGEEAINFVEEKYGRDFTPYHYEYSDYLSSTDAMWCYTDGLNTEEDEYVHVYVSQNEKGEVEFRDDYFGYIVRPQVEEHVKELVQTEFDEVKVYGSNPTGSFPNELTAESTLEDVFESGIYFDMNIDVFAKGDGRTTEDEYGKKIKRIEKLMLDSKHTYCIRIYVLSDEIYESIERYNVDDEFLKFRLEMGEPDGEKWYYEYSELIHDGEVR